MQQPLRHSIVFTAKRRTSGGIIDPSGDEKPAQPEAPPDLRLFWMSDPQAELFENTVQALLVTNGRVTREQATEVVERFVIRLLAGQMPRETDPTSFHRMRLSFPILKREQIEACPRAGCPEGWIEALVLTLGNAQGAHTAVHYELSAGQCTAFNDGLVEIMARNRCTRDEAWVCLNNLVGMLITAGVPEAKSVEQFIADMAEKFPKLAITDATLDDEKNNPRRATEDDVRRWSFTMVSREAANRAQY